MTTNAILLVYCDGDLCKEKLEIDLHPSPAHTNWYLIQTLKAEMSDQGWEKKNSNGCYRAYCEDCAAEKRRNT